MMRLSAGSAMLLLAGCACAQDMQQVTISATKTEERERATTTAIVIGRDDLARQGDGTLADVLKRQPGITIDGAPGRPATVRMRGLGNGYASILLNGQPAPSGFSLESISPDLIERIEIMRAASAEFSSQAIAGTINVVLRKGPSGKQGELKAGVGFTHGRAAPTIAGQRSGRQGALSYTIGVTVKRSDVDIPADTIEEGTGPALVRQRLGNERFVDDMFELAPRLSWQPPGGDSWTSQSYLRLRRMDNRGRDNETLLVGSPSEFPNSQSHYVANPRYLYSDVSWTRRLDDGRVTAKLSGYSNTRDASFVFDGADAANVPSGRHLVASGPQESDISFSGSYRRSINGAHALAAGWEAGRKRRGEYRREQQFDASNALTLATDEHYSALVQRTALFVQDEWDITPRWSLYLGVRREDLHTLGEGNAHVPVDLRSGVWSPVAQTLFKAGDAEPGQPRDQFRLALGRTYKPPQIVQLMPRRYTVDNNNNPTNPDQQGNPNLRPELAWSVDAAWERYFGKDGMISISTYAKRIRDVTLDHVDDSTGVWMATPKNSGNATVHGIELEARFGWRALAARANVARNWSHVDSVPGPDNRLDAQPALTATLGLDYQPGASRLAAGGSFSYRSGGAVRESETRSGFTSAKRELDLYAAWQLSPGSKLRLAAINLLHQDYLVQALYADATRSLLRTNSLRSFATWRAAWEHSW
ncbi:TonB-dependent receptor plug domain-containing protein [Massilia horti]|uniref:TonB-dependent receptor n=1 Tax=Massilia horti TaxID=2562153 RepID=A0A4Y9SXS5_9BURK|nr:TonB-dependent receptor [Massilia horti]TFW29536.1 TonB-dependent receptor [Massilia horti]